MNSLHFLHDAVLAYRSPNIDQRECDINSAISTVSARSKIGQWLHEHPNQVAGSFVLKDLHDRIFKPIELIAPDTDPFPSLMSTAIGYVANTYKVLTGRWDAADIEKAILTGNLKALKSLLKNNIDELIKNSQLLKTHLSIGTLSFKEVLPIVAGAAELAMGKASPAFPETQTTRSVQYPSLLHMFSNELKGFISSSKTSPTAEEMHSLLRQDKASLVPHLSDVDILHIYFENNNLGNKRGLISSLSIDKLVEITTKRNEDGNTLLHRPTLLKLFLPELIEKLPRRSLLDLLSNENYNSLAPYTIIDKEIINSLTRIQCLRLCAVLSTSTIDLISFKSILPYVGRMYINKLLDVFHDFQLCVNVIRQLKELSKDEHDAAIAFCIESKEIPLSLLEGFLNEQEFLRLAVHLHYVDLRNFESLDLGAKILQNCPHLNVLHISNSELLDEIKELPQCTYFNCNDCRLVKALPKLPQCIELLCQNCLNLIALPMLGQCRYCDCRNNIMLKYIPPLPFCTYLNYSNCPGVQDVPEVPFNTIVVSESETTRQLNINVEQFDTDPVALLTTLGKHLLSRRSFPTICYTDNDLANQAQDNGGVGRDFVTRLSENLFKTNIREADKGKFLKLHTNSIPEAITAEEREKAAYRTLGAIFVLCGSSNLNLKTGPLFNESVYECLCSPGDPKSDEWLLKNLLGKSQLSFPESIAELFLNHTEKIPQLTKKDLIALAVLADRNPEIFSMMYLESHLNEIKRDLLNLAQTDKSLIAISWIAQGMKSRLHPHTWNAIKTQGAIALKFIVEGMLNAESLISKIQWEDDSGADPEKVEKIKMYMNNWIEHSPIDRLSLFVRAVTGNKTLCAAELTISVSNFGDEFIPNAHTCSYTLKLSSEYKDQAQFNQKLDLFLTEGLAGSGFTFL